jgi:hypothetical protein
MPLSDTTTRVPRKSNPPISFLLRRIHVDNVLEPAPPVDDVSRADWDMLHNILSKLHKTLKLRWFEDALELAAAADVYAPMLLQPEWRYEIRMTVHKLIRKIKRLTK